MNNSEHLLEADTNIDNIKNSDNIENIEQEKRRKISLLSGCEIIFTLVRGGE